MITLCSSSLHPFITARSLATTLFGYSMGYMSIAAGTGFNRGERRGRAGFRDNGN